MMKQLLVLTSTLALVVAVGCSKEEKDGGDDKGAGETGETGKTGNEGETKPEDPPKEVKTVEMDLPKTGLKIMLPEDASIDEAMIANADQITLAGVQSKMVVKPRGGSKNEELEGHLKWAKEHQIQKFKKEILKEGSGATFTYIHEVDQGGKSLAVYKQMFQVGDKGFICFSNADNEAAAMAMKKACDTIKAGGDSGAAAPDDKEEEGEGW